MNKDNSTFIEVWDKSESYDLVIYKFKIGFMTYLAEVEISTNRLLILRDYERYIQDLPEDKLLVGEPEYNSAYRRLIEGNFIK